jgi:hypothetical protein
MWCLYLYICEIGMGLDKSNVRGVIHYSVPHTFENYVQEVGRAGRDGRAAWCHAFFNEHDVTRSQSLVHSDGVDRLTIKKFFYRIFGERQPFATPSVIAIDQQSLLDDLVGTHIHCTCV